MADIQPIVTRPAAAAEEKSPADSAVAPVRPEAEPAVSTSDLVLDPEQRAEAIEQIRAALEEVRPPEWQVSIWEDEDTGTVVVEIRDEEGETIKQFPPEKILNLQRKLADLAGVVVDETT